jgi:aspartyl-tRNA(Asn)/glutamyl-tRNA(Gln) amidotransferase subunit A
MAKAPRISGRALRTLASFARTKMGSLAVQRVLRKDLNMDALAALPSALRGPLPISARPLQARPPRGDGAGARLPAPKAPWSLTSEGLANAYRAGDVTPRQVTERMLAAARALAARNPPFGPLVEYAEDAALRVADEAGARWRAGHPLGPLDGIPYAVKEQMFVTGCARRAGTTFIAETRAEKDATCIHRLHESGAIVIGLTNMTELGMTPTGVNSKRVMPRNPHAGDRIAGGSSTGSGVAVSTGLVPFAMGADGGGSIRIPSAMNGVFGIKPTWGRISREGDVSGGSVAHLGPLASSTLDLARVLDAASGADPLDPETLAAPPKEPGQFERAVSRGIKGLTVGVCDGEWREASRDVARAGEQMIAALEREGATIERIVLPLAKHAPAIGYVTIAGETRADHSEDWTEHADEMSHDLQVTFAALETFTALEYLDAQRLRAGLRAEVARAFEKVDLLALPTTAITAACVSDEEMETGFLDAKLIDGLCRFAFLGNLTGLPAASMPAGKDEHGLPIGFQLVGDAWDEGTVLAASAHLERIGAAAIARPSVSVDILL